MKKLSLLFAMLLLLLNCNKETSPSPSPHSTTYWYHFYGKVRDANTQLPIPNVVLYVLGAEYDFDCPWGFCGYGEWASAATNETGEFQLSFKTSFHLDLNSANINLKISEVMGYQCTALINEITCNGLCDKEAFYGQPDMDDSTYLDIKLLPN